LEAIREGIVTSTSVMVYGKAVDDVAKLVDISDISIGLHVHMEKTIQNPQEEFDKQIEILTRLLGRAPDHIDVHKPRSSDMKQLMPLLKQYSEEHHTPIRELGHVKSIKDFFGIDVKNENEVDPERVSVDNLLQILENLKEEVSEIMTHVGYSDDELRSISSYSDTRELELQTLTDKRVIEYFDKQPNIQLINWRDISV